MPEAGSEFDLDLDALAPRPRGWVRVGGERYAVWSLLDVPIADMAEILAGQRHPPERLDEQVSMMRRHLRLLVPTLPEELLAGLTTRKLLALYDRALGVSNPPAETGEAATASIASDWASSSPSPVGSTAGAPGSSSG